MTNKEVSQLLNTSLATVMELGEQLGVACDQWTVPDLMQADELLEEAEDDDDD